MVSSVELKKQQIIERAKTLFLTRGFKSTTIQAIADECGMSKGAVYLQFSSKKEIFFGIVMETDEQVWQQVKNVRTQSIAPREKLLQILNIYFEFIHENRRLSELLIHEVGLQLSEEMLEQTEAMRFRWQNSIDESVKEVLGADYEQWKSDLGFTVTGLMECFHGFLLIGQVHITKESLTDYLMLLIDTMGPALQKAGFQPMINPASLESQTRKLADLESQRWTEIQTTLEHLKRCLDDACEGPSIPRSLNKIYVETYDLLHSECLSEAPNKAIVQGMLAGLRQVSEVSLPRQKLAMLMGVQTI